MKNTAAVFLFFFAITSYLAGQESDIVFFDRISSENIKIEKGLSQNTVYSIIQDKDGFMWFGTWDGLNKYDGNKFTIYNKVNGLTNETIYSLLQDSKGMIWIGTEEGLNKFNPLTGKITNYTSDPDDSTTISNNWINDIYEDKDGQIFIATSRGLNIYNEEQDNFSQFLIRKSDNSSIRSNWVNEILQDRLGNFWYATRYGLIMFDASNHVITRFYHKPGDENSLAGNKINTLAFDDVDNLWVGTTTGLSKLNLVTKKFQNYYSLPSDPSSIGSNNITDILLDKKKRLWIATDGGGMSLYFPEADSFRHFRHNVNNNSSISNDRTFVVYEDNNSIIWVGTFKGVSKIDEKSGKFKGYRNDPETNNSLNNNFVRDFLEAEKGVIWIATEGGINIYHEESSNFDFIQRQSGKKNTLASNNIRDIFKDSRGNYWLGTSDSGLIRYMPDKKQFKTFSYNPLDSNSILSNFIQIINEDKQGYIWIGTAGGLSRYNPQNGIFTNYPVHPDKPASRKFSRIYDIYQDSTGIIWFASQNGLTYFNPERKKFGSVLIPQQNSEQIISNKLFSIYEDKQNNFWLSTRGGGLVKYDRANDSFRIFSEKDGLPNNVVYGLLPDNKGNYWISTNWGLSKFNPVEEIFINYDVKDGLQSNEFNANALLKAESGRMYFGGMNGFTSFYPDDIIVNTNIPPVRITGFNIFNHPIDYGLVQKDTIHLRYDDNFFSIEFAALDFTNPSRNKYMYMLEGFDKDWRETSAGNPTAEYTKVAPGTYTFKVLGSNNDGYWNTEGDEITIQIKPPWWENWIFRMLVILFILGLIWFLIYLRIKRIKSAHRTEKKMLELEKQMFDIEQKALQLQMNPHFIFNSLNSIQSFVLKNDTDKAISYLAKFSQLMRMMLANSRETYIPLSTELTALRYYMDIEKLRFDNKFEYEINIAKDIDEEFMEIPPMILQPYIENAILHGLIHNPARGIILINFTLEGNRIRCIIEDNGIGREKSEMIRKESGFKRKSRGLIITKERLDLLSHQQKDKFSVNIIDLKDAEGNATGTRVELMIIYRES